MQQATGLGLVWTLVFCVAAQTNSSLPFSLSSPDNEVTINWNITENTMEMELVGRFSVGWFAWGVSDSSSMSRTDVCWVMCDGVQVQVVDAYTKEHHETPLVDATQNLNVTSTSINGTVVTVRASRLLNSGDRRDVVVKPQSTQFLLYAYRKQDTAASFAQLSKHSTKGSFSVTLGTGKASTIVYVGNKGVHAFFMFASWGVLVPLGIAVARYCRAFEWWFFAHRALQGVALGGSAAGIWIGWDAADTHYGSNNTHHSHTVIGYIVLGLGFLLPIIVSVRPYDQKPRSRQIWVVVHRTAGLCTLGFAIWNIFTGVVLYKKITNYTTACTIYFVVIGSSFIVAEFARFVVEQICGKRKVHPANTV